MLKTICHRRRKYAVPSETCIRLAATREKSEDYSGRAGIKVGFAEKMESEKIVASKEKKGGKFSGDALCLQNVPMPTSGFIAGGVNGEDEFGRVRVDNDGMRRAQKEAK